MNARAHALAAAVEEERAATPAIGRPVPAHASVLIPFDPRRIAPNDVMRVLRHLVAKAPTGAAAPPRKPVEIPVRYGGSDGPDLDEVAGLCGLGPEAIVELHAGATYRVRFLGFAPGFPYLGPLPAPLAVPRRATPRERVPAGSVAIAGQQTAIYPTALPGGWRLIGRTDVVLFDPAASAGRPNLLAPGDAVRFVPRR
jgi:KipI family sensor histidine kinase inhibitor